MASFRAKHRRAAQKKQDGIVTLNLVSLTDFFTILLVFLLANSTETEVLTMNSATYAVSDGALSGDIGCSFRAMSRSTRTVADPVPGDI